MQHIENMWYPAALSHEVTTKPVKEIMFGTPVVLFRTESGKVAALDDKCPHRFVPLNMGNVVGENIECPYHGLQFNSTGMCALNPHGDGKIPAAAKVKAYDLAERNGVVWIWKGDPALADVSKIFDLDDFLGTGDMPIIGDSFTVNANVGIVLDNIMDVSHAPFIHRTTFAQHDHAGASQFEMVHEGDTVWANTRIRNVGCSPLFKPFWKSEAPKVDTIANMRWDAPFLAQLDVGVMEVGAPDDTGIHMYVSHMLRPIDDNTTRYFWQLARNFAHDNEAVSAKIKEKINEGFHKEDEPVVAESAANMGTIDLMSLKPVLLPGDAAAIRVRRIIEQMQKDAQSVQEAA